MTEPVDFNQVPLLVIDEQTLSLGKVLQYFQLSGKLLPFIREVVDQHVIYQELQNRTDLDVSMADLEQAMIDFRLQNQLTDSATFQQWLTSQNINHSTLQSRVLLRLKLNKLVDHVTEPNLQTYFEQEQDLLEQLDLSCVMSTDKGLIEGLKQKIQTGKATFEQVLRRYALNEDDKISVMRGLVRRGQLPEDLRNAIAIATPGELIGPLATEQRWSLFQVGEVIPAKLEGELKQTLQKRLFEQWLAEQVQNLRVAFANG